MANRKKTVVQKKTTKPKVVAGKEMGSWNGHKFTISPTRILSFNDLKIKGSSEMEGKDESTQGYVARKGANPTETEITIHLNAMTGCDVRKEAMGFVSDARDGEFDYFYIGGSKLVPYKLMLTDAQVSEVEMTGKGTWIKADVSLTLKQCNHDGSGGGGSSSGGGSDDYSGGGSSGGSSKVSAYDSSPTVPKTTSRVSSIMTATKPTGTPAGSVSSGTPVRSILETAQQNKISQAQSEINRINYNVGRARAKSDAILGITRPGITSGAGK